MSKRLTNIVFKYEDKHYEFGFGLEQVQQLSSYSLSAGNNLKPEEVLKIALAQNSETSYISDKKIEDINELLLGGIETEDGDYLNYQELFRYLLGLFAQAIDDAAKEVEPAVVTINKDSSVDVVMGAENYKLMFTREHVIEILETGAFEFNGILDLYATGSRIVREALQHYNKRLSARKHEEIFLSLWATKFDKETEDDLLEVINALTYHAKEVVESGAKKSRAAFKVKMK